MDKITEIDVLTVNLWSSIMQEIYSCTNYSYAYQTALLWRGVFSIQQNEKLFEAAESKNHL